MRKLVVLLAVFSGTLMAYPRSGQGKMHMWCEQNWEKCKEYKLETLKIREKYIPKERECLEKASTFQDMRSCMVDLREQMRREFYDLRKKMLKEVNPQP
ncbi:MAG: hypothetical protein D6674_04520 [Acidobacteria bacterium]|jgi:hypothetical protein|nr:MAG: hypothetical protein D6674_04520 [Acidobacteriota bacterium]